MSFAGPFGNLLRISAWQTKSAWDLGSENPNFPEAWVLRFGGKNRSPLSFSIFRGLCLRLLRQRQYEEEGR